MITTPEHNRRLICLTKGDLKNGLVRVKGLRGMLPSGCVGQSKKSKGLGRTIRIWLQGINRWIETDIASEAKTGFARGHFRERRWTKKFFIHHNIKCGDKIEFERLGELEYRLRPLGAIPRFAEFFAGIGLVRLALEDCGFQTVFANDIDPDKLALYRDNFTTEEFRLGDIHLVRQEEIPDCDLATASFPCTDLSIAGQMNGINSGESSAFWGLTRLLDEMGRRRPPVVLLENVPGFLIANGGKDFEAAMLSLNALGYACDAFLLDAAAFVPQSRLRLFVVGRLESIESGFSFVPTILRPPVLAEYIASHANIRWSLRELPSPPKRTTTLESILEDLEDDDPAWWSKERADYFVGQFSERHAAIAKRMIAPKSYSYATAFRRVRKGRSMAELRTDGLAGCLRTPRGGSGRQILFKAGNNRYQVRLLTARECARLQGVPDTYSINVPLNKALFGFGDAVCVRVIEWIAEHYLLPCLANAASQDPVPGGMA